MKGSSSKGGYHRSNAVNCLLNIANKLQQKHIPIASMYGIFTYIYHKNQPNVGKYTIHGSYGI